MWQGKGSTPDAAVSGVHVSWLHRWLVGVRALLCEAQYIAYLFHDEIWIDYTDNAMYRREILMETLALGERERGEYEGEGWGKRSTALFSLPTRCLHEHSWCTDTTYLLDTTHAPLRCLNYLAPYSRFPQWQILKKGDHGSSYANEEEQSSQGLLHPSIRHSTSTFSAWLKTKYMLKIIPILLLALERPFLFISREANYLDKSNIIPPFVIQKRK